MENEMNEEMAKEETSEVLEESPAKKKLNKKLLKKIGYYALIVFFSLVFIGSAIYLIDYLVRSSQANSEYSDLQDLYVPPSRPVINPDGTITYPSDPTEPTNGDTTPTEPTILPELQVFYDQNPHLVGWITVPNTKINYPVVQQPKGTAEQYRDHHVTCNRKPWDLSEYYLKHTFNGSCSDWGAIFVREACNVFTPSDNITIYGHHMKDGSMFSGLDGYKKKSFWESHQYIYFDTLYERHVYQVIVAFKTSANTGQGYPYHLFDDARDESEFNEFIAAVKSLAYYDTGLSAQYGDKLITLSTCEYSLDEGRHVVIAKRIA